MARQRFLHRAMSFFPSAMGAIGRIRSAKDKFGKFYRSLTSLPYVGQIVSKAIDDAIPMGSALRGGLDMLGSKIDEIDDEMKAIKGNVVRVSAA